MAAPNPAVSGTLANGSSTVISLDAMGGDNGPATVVADLPIVRRQPRSQGFGLEPDLEVLRNEIWSLLETEARRHAQR
jgi:fatty acid/phospholipid biosynthesis enzyme